MDAMMVKSKGARKDSHPFKHGAKEPENVCHPPVEWAPRHVGPVCKEVEAGWEVVKQPERVGHPAGLDVAPVDDDAVVLGLYHDSEHKGNNSENEADHAVADAQSVYALRTGRNPRRVVVLGDNKFHL